MKIVSALILALLLAFNSQTTFAQSKMFPGVVVKVDQPAKKITINHGPIPQLDMDEPMTMVYAASDPTMLTGLKAGDKVNFEAKQVNGQYTVTKIEKAR